MRESCSCGAAIHTLFYSRAITWRLTHLHSEAEAHDIDSETQVAQPIGFALPDDDEEEEC